MAVASNRLLAICSTLANEANDDDGSHDARTVPPTPNRRAKEVEFSRRSVALGSFEPRGSLVTGNGIPQGLRLSSCNTMQYSYRLVSIYYKIEKSVGRGSLVSCFVLASRTCVCVSRLPVGWLQLDQPTQITSGFF